MEWRLSPYGEEYDNSRKLGDGEWGEGRGAHEPARMILSVSINLCKKNTKRDTQKARMTHSVYSMERSLSLNANVITAPKNTQ